MKETIFNGEVSRVTVIINKKTMDDYISIEKHNGDSLKIAMSQVGDLITLLKAKYNDYGQRNN